MRKVELSGLVAAHAGGFHEPPALVVLDDARVSVAVGDEDVALGVPGHVGRPVERVRLVRARVAALSAQVGELLERFGPAAERDDDAAGGVELDHHVRPFVDHPDVVVPVDADGMREDEPIEALPQLADERAGLVEFEKPCLPAARVHEHVSLGIGRDADAFAEVKARRQLEEVRDRVVGDLRNVLRLGFALSEGRRAAEERRDDEGERDGSLHKAPPEVSNLSR